ncbi:TonB family protein [Pontibacter anaerobius]|uniref:TonB family protein n=1 Tax=Pontibacter anaerobius TaxID=2993940 RepID=A0ABT3RGK5_9BACT|nr:TonB family protein [Pontibacter anaerobius]MCX2740966.1 TonB family protein [Pontibacter anaerobius]
MPHDKHHILWPDGDHPSLELLRQYQQGDLPAALHHQLERHLLGCALCADVLEGMEVSDAGQTKAAVTDINQRIQAQAQQRKEKAAPVYWQSAAAILILVASAMLVLYYNYQKQQPAQELAKTEILADEELPNVAANEPVAPAAADTQSTEISEKSIAAVTPARKYTSPLVRADAEEVSDLEFDLDDAVVEEEVPDNEALDTVYLADKGEATTKKSSSQDYATITESKPLASPSMAVAPESLDVSKALSGKVAGVSIRGVSTVRPRNNSAANQKQITGRVLSEEGEPLSGVAVLLKGKAIGTVTDAEGNYSLALPEGEQTLRFSFIGFETAEKTLAQNDTSADITMAQDQRSLSEVVVTGYGVQREVPEKVSPMPVPRMRQYKKYLQENSRTVPVSGKVKVAFTVGTNGKPQQIRVVKSLCPACDAEAIRLVQEGPRWKPGQENGQPVEREVRLSIKFKD